MAILLVLLLCISFCTLSMDNENPGSELCNLYEKISLLPTELQEKISIHFLELCDWQQLKGSSLWIHITSEEKKQSSPRLTACFRTSSDRNYPYVRTRTLRQGKKIITLEEQPVDHTLCRKLQSSGPNKTDIFITDDTMYLINGEQSSSIVPQYDSPRALHPSRSIVASVKPTDETGNSQRVFFSQINQKTQSRRFLHNYPIIAALSNECTLRFCNDSFLCHGPSYGSHPISLFHFSDAKNSYQIDLSTLFTLQEALQLFSKPLGTRRKAEELLASLKTNTPWPIVYKTPCRSIHTTENLSQFLLISFFLKLFADQEENIRYGSCGPLYALHHMPSKKTFLLPSSNEWLNKETLYLAGADRCFQFNAHECMERESNLRANRYFTILEHALSINTPQNSNRSTHNSSLSHIMRIIRGPSIIERIYALMLSSIAYHQEQEPNRQTRDRVSQFFAGCSTKTKIRCRRFGNWIKPYL